MKLRVGIIGTGGMGKTHTASFMNNPAVEVTALCSRSKKRLSAFCGGKWNKVEYAHETLGDFQSRYKIQKGYTDAREMAKDKDIDAVSITTPNALHFPQAKLFLQAGKHVLLEKPIAVNAKQCRELISLAKKHKRLLMAAQCWRFHPEVNEIKKFVQDKRFGKIVKTKSYGIHVNWGPPGWFIDKKLAAGGALLDMGVHAIDTVRYILGEPKAKKVYAKVTTAFGKYKVDDMSVLMIEFEDGTLSIVEAGWWHPYAEGGEATTVVMGTKGYGRIFPYEAAIYEDGKKVTYPSLAVQNFSNEKLYQAEINHFVDCIIQRVPCAAPGEAGLDAAKIMDAAILSQRRGVPVKV